MRIKEQIRELILSLGADVCGFANVDSFDKAPSGFKPRDIFSDCQSLISFGMALPKGLAQINPRLVYKYFNDMGIYMIDELKNGVVNQKLCRNHAYGKTKRGFNTTDCNRCRTICPMRYGDEYK